MFSSLSSWFELRSLTFSPWASHCSHAWSVEAAASSCIAVVQTSLTSWKLQSEGRDMSLRVIRTEEDCWVDIQVIPSSIWIWISHKTNSWIVLTEAALISLASSITIDISFLQALSFIHVNSYTMQKELTLIHTVSAERCHNLSS